jgi:signal transduction histidine kinase
VIVALPQPRWERHETLILRIVPFAALAVSTVLVILADTRSWAFGSGTLGLAAVTAIWMLGLTTLRPAWTKQAHLMFIYYAGLLVLSGVLLLRSPGFGFFAWTGYVQVSYLPGRWQWAGLAATALLVSSTYVGGFQHIDASTLPIYLVFVAASIALAGTFMFFGAKQRATLDELAEANAMLEATLEENAGLHAQLLTQAREAGILDERQRMAREIHDTLAQGFTGIVAQLEAARQNPEKWRRYTDQAQALARDNLSDARRSVQALRPSHLDDALLPDAIARMGERWSQTSGVPICVETAGEPKPMIADVEVALFRVAQEALTNVARHARASQVGLTLSYLDDVVLLDVRDDGVGFETGVDSGGFGMASMRQRLLRVAGSLVVESRPGEGTAINASVPALPSGCTA